MSQRLIETKLSEIKFPYYVLPGDWLIVDFDQKITFNNREDLLDYLETGITEEEKQDLRDDHIEGDYANN